jgi:hypothetical protein
MSLSETVMLEIFRNIACNSTEKNILFEKGALEHFSALQRIFPNLRMSQDSQKRLRSQSLSPPHEQRARSQSLSPPPESSEDDSSELPPTQLVPHPFSDVLGSLFSVMIGGNMSFEWEDDVAETLMDQVPEVWKTSGFDNALKLFSSFRRVKTNEVSDGRCSACHRECSKLRAFQFRHASDDFSMWTEDEEGFLQNLWPSGMYPLPIMRTIFPKTPFAERSIVFLGQRCSSQAKAFHWLFHVKAKIADDFGSVLMNDGVTNLREFDAWIETAPGYRFCLNASETWSSIQERFDESKWTDQTFYASLEIVAE